VRIDTARVNGCYYATEASIGISSRLARRQRPADKQRFGFFAVAATLVQALGLARPFHVEVSWGSHRERFKTVQLTVANSARFGGVVSVHDAAIDDGRLDLYAVQIESFAEFLSVAGAIAAGRRRAGPGLRTYRAAAFDVATHRPHRISADGEPAGKTPARFEVLPKSLRVFVP
jgi:diacylglycerol kinase (ATP)